MTNPIHKRGRYSTDIKKKVATEAIAGNKTIARIASLERLLDQREFELDWLSNY